METLTLFKCLSDDTRLKACLLLAEHGELCVCELVVALDVIQPKISRHLAQLRKAGLLTDRKQGQWVYYRINPELPRWTLDIIKQTQQNNIDYVDNCNARLQGMTDRPPASGCC